MFEPIRSSALVLLAFATACGGRSDAGLDSTFGNSSAVVNSRADLEAAPEVLLTEEMLIGGPLAPPAAQFGSIRDMALAPAGELYVLDRVNFAVKVFDVSGKLARTFGKSGQGPAEFQNPTFLAASNDTVIVMESRKFHVFSATGAGLATGKYVTDHPTGYVDVRGIQRTAAGWTLISNTSPASRVPHGTAYQDTIEGRMFAPGTGDRSPAIVKFPGPVSFLFGSAGWMRDRFMSASPFVSITPNGTVYMTPGDEYVIRLFTPVGTADRAIQATVDRIPVSDADFSRSIASELAGYDKSGARVVDGELAELIAMLKYDASKAGHADFRPVLGRLIASPEGSVLAERLDLDPNPEAPGDSVRWDLFGSNGRIKGRMVTAPNMRPRLMTGDHVYMLMISLDDEQYVARYKLAVRSASRPR